MREAFNNNSNTQQQQQVNKQKLQKLQPHQQNQLSQRSTQAAHQKTNSVGSKVMSMNNYKVMGMDEQQHQQYHAQATLNSQQSNSNNQFQQQMDQKLYGQQHQHEALFNQQILSSQNPSSAVQHGFIQGAKTHKKSNSLMNSKIAQMLLKNTPSTGNHINEQQHQQIINNQKSQKSQQPIHQQIQQHNPLLQQKQLNSNTLYQQQQQYFYQAQLMTAAQQNQQQHQQQQHQQQIANQNGLIDFKHLNKNASNNLTNSLIGGPAVSHQSSFSNQGIEIGSGQLSVDFQQQPHLLEENMSEELFTRNLNALKQIQQISKHQSLTKQQQKAIHQQQAQLQQQLNLDAYIQQNLMTLQEQKQINQQLKKQITTKDNQVAVKGNSAQKNVKKVVQQPVNQGYSHHRTKSDTYNNRGSLGKGQQPSSIKKNAAGSNHQNVKQMIEALETVNSRQIVNANVGGTHQKTNSMNFMINNTVESQTANQKKIVKKVPNSASHSKKSSYNNHTLYQQINSSGAGIVPGLGPMNSKKTQADKYNELKAMYDDLLERHYAQQNQLNQPQNIQLKGKDQYPQRGINNNLISFQKVSNFMNIPQSVTIQSQNDQQLVFDQNQNSNTPRLSGINSKSDQPKHQILQKIQLQSEINAYQNAILEASNKNIIQIPAKLLKQQQAKLELQQQQQQEKLYPKTALKLNLPQGQSRKNAAGRHKRSVSDGNEQLFKFKQQQQMQKYLYPQPSNQNFKVLNGGNGQQLTIQPNFIDQHIAPPMNSEETIQSNRNGKAVLSQQQSIQNLIQGPTPYMQANHHRRVSDDYLQKQKKSQQLLQNSNGLIQQQDLIHQNMQYSNNQSKNTGLSFVGENINSDGSQQDNQKLKTIDFNVKGFLLEMRNKHTSNHTGAYGGEHSQSMNIRGPNNTELINIIDEQYQPQYSYIPPSPSDFKNEPNIHKNKMALKNGKQFAMIIEENHHYQNSPMEIVENFYQNEHEYMIHGQSFEEPKINTVNLLDSQRKHIIISDSQSNQMISQAIYKGSSMEFKKKIKSAKNQRLDQKRSSSPNINEFDKKQTIFAHKSNLVQVSHKRIKSDMPEIPKKLFQGGNIAPQVNQKYQIQTNNKKGEGVLNNIIKQKVLQQNISSSINQNSSYKMGNGSGQNMYIHSEKTTPKKIMGKQILNFGLAPEQLYQQQKQLSQQFEGSEGKKVVNVSVDLMKDGFSAGMLVDEDLQENISFLNDSNNEPNNYDQSDKWLQQENYSSLEKQMKKQEKVVQNQQLVINNIPAQNKHQKLLQQQKQPITRVTKKSIVPGSAGIVIQGQPQSKVALSGGNELVQRHEKYKKMILKYDNNVDNQNSGSKSNRKHTYDAGNSMGNSSCLSPSGIALHSSPKNRLSIIDKNGDYRKQKSTKLISQGSPKNLIMGMQYQKQQVKIQNLMQPMNSKQTTDKDLDNANISERSSRVVQSKKSDHNPPNNSVVQTQETPRSSIVIQANLIIPQNIGERVDTQDSTISDPNLSPRTRGVNKLIKHIKLSFRSTALPPNTTVDFYRIGKVLGKGAFGKVNLALHKLSGKFAAVKSINKQYLSEEAQTKKVMQEVVILKRTRHRNIVRLYEFFETQKHILFVIELCAGGDLLNYVRRRRRLKEDVAKCIFKQIIEGLGYCHSKSILHRDIKLDNILLDSEGEVKICDFGVSKIVKKGEIMTEQCGTPAYIAPEILRDKGYEGFSVDIWSAGVVLYAMLYGTVPFKANNMSELQKLIIKANYTLKDDISEEARSLLTGLLEKDPHKRLTIEEILQHQWLLDASEKIQLFTQQEKDYIKNEFTYNDTDRFNRNETDPFTEHMLDSTNNSMLKNQTSKSVILAPFNSTKSDLRDDTPALTESMKALLQSKRCMKFAPRVRDIDKQYEINNNAELDNGVYHKLEEEEEVQPVENDQKSKEELKINKKKLKELNGGIDSLQSSFNKESSLRSDDEEENIKIHKNKKSSAGKEKQTELQKLESLIYQQEDDIDNPYQEILNDNNKNNHNDQILIRDEQQQQFDISIEDRTPRIDNRIENSASRVSHSAGGHHNNHYGLQTAQTLIIDEHIIGSVELMGYSREYIIKCLNNNELNYASAGYYLLQNQHSLSFGDPLAKISSTKQLSIFR